MITSYDIGAIAFYFILMIGVTFAFRKQITDTSEYFRGGGKMLWWMCGSSAFMSTFSAWTFSGAAGKAYVDGFTVVFIMLFNAAAYLICSLVVAHRFRQLRVITPVQAIRQRFGKTSEQVFTWFKIVSALNTGALSLIAVSVFMSAVIGVDQNITIIGTGAVIIFMTFLGGSWAVIASDFLQALLIIAVSIVTFVFAYNESGGFMAVVNNFPAESFMMGNGITYTEIFLLWVGAIFLQRVIGVNSLSQSIRFLSAKDSVHARKAAMLAAVLFLFGAVMWFFPPMFAAIKYTNLSEMYPTLRNAADASYLAVVQDLLPAGMVGLVLAAMFAATMSSLDSQINGCSATIVKNFYVPIVRPDSSEAEQLSVSRIVTIVFGVGIIVLALFFNQLKGISLFQLMVTSMALVHMPMFVPQLFGIFARKIPDWAAWGTLIFGVVISILSSSFINAQWFSDVLGITYSSREMADLGVVIPQLAHAILTVGFFFSTRFFYKEPVGVRKQELDTFFDNVERPVIAPEGTSAEDNMQRKYLGIMSMIFGGGVLVMGMLPGVSMTAFVITGGFMLVTGYLLFYSSRMPTTAETSLVAGN